MNEELLPVGSVVEVANEYAPLLMIMGYFPENATGASDYLAAPYPLGIQLESAGVMLNESDIVRVVHRGYQDDLGALALKEARAIVSLSDTSDGAGMSRLRGR